MPPVSECLHHNMYLMAASAAGDFCTTLWFVRLVERMRRAIAHEYGLPLVCVSPKLAFVSRMHADSDDAARQSLHVDESSFEAFHYSAVLYLSSHGVDFEGGTFAFADGPESTAGAVGPESTAGAVPAPSQIREVAPSAGVCLTFSSGWENPHAVAPLSAGLRMALPAFFQTTSEDVARHRLAPVGDDAELAQVLWRTALRPETEGDFKVLLRDWHALLAMPPQDATRR